MCSSGLEALSCPFSTKFLRSTDLRFTTSPAIATYTLLAAVIHRLSWIRPSKFGLKVADIGITLSFRLIILPSIF